MTGSKHDPGDMCCESVTLCGARYTDSTGKIRPASIVIDRGRIGRIAESVPLARSQGVAIDLGGYLLLPGLINAHDHLQFALYPRLGKPPYRNYIDWGEDIHSRFAGLIAQQHSIPRSARLWWGGIRNLLCGATTVCHHNPLWPELTDAHFPVRVVSRYGWAHSPALGADPRIARANTPAGAPFIMHACEGTDERSREELGGLERLGLLDDHTVLVHGLAIDARGVQLLRRRDVSLIVCPSSNEFLFQKLPDPTVLGHIPRTALGSDSPLTAAGDLLDEIRFAVQRCGVSPRGVWQMVTTAPAAILRLVNGEGSLRKGGVADLIAVRDHGQTAADSLVNLSASDIELVLIGGRVQLASQTMLERLPALLRDGLQPLYVDGTLRWLRAPVAGLMQTAEATLGAGKLRLGARSIGIPALVEMADVR